MSIHSTRPALPPVVELAALIRSGVSMADAGAMYGASARSVQSRLNNAGYERTGEVQTTKKAAPRVPDAPDTRIPNLSEGLCKDSAHDPETWFDDAPRFAKRICLGDPFMGVPGCPVRMTCLEGALLRNEEYGVFGGLDPKERRALTRNGKKTEAAA